MSYDFPNAPSNGQIAIGPGGISYVWDNTKWASTAAAGTAYAPIASPVFTGDPQAPTPVSTDSDTSIATTAFVQAVAAPFGNNTGRNLVHNGQFTVAQRGVGPWTTSGAYTADRWTIGVGGGSLSVQVSTLADADRGAIGDEAARYSLGLNCVGTGGANDQAYVEQHIEDLRRLSGKTVTVSFWAVAASGAFKLGVNVIQYFGSGGSPSATVQVAGQAVTLATTWARYSLTFSVPSTAGKTIGSNNDGSTFLRFWQSSGANNNVNAGGIGVQSYVMALWGVQLEIGSTATPLAKRDPADELALCQRFYQTGLVQLGGYTVAGVGASYAMLLPVVMRGAPTITPGTPSTNINTGTPSLTANAQTIVLNLNPPATGGYLYVNTFTASADL